MCEVDPISQESNYKSTILTTNCSFFSVSSNYNDFKVDAYVITFNQFTVESITILYFFYKVALNLE